MAQSIISVLRLRRKAGGKRPPFKSNPFHQESQWGGAGNEFLETPTTQESHWNEIGFEDTSSGNKIK